LITAFSTGRKRTISCSQPGPADGWATRVGWQGWMKPAGGLSRERAGEIRHNMPAIWWRPRAAAAADEHAARVRERAGRWGKPNGVSNYPTLWHKLTDYPTKLAKSQQSWK
jgi:hypothetical protein